MCSYVNRMMLLVAVVAWPSFPAWVACRRALLWPRWIAVLALVVAAVL